MKKIKERVFLAVILMMVFFNLTESLAEEKLTFDSKVTFSLVDPISFTSHIISEKPLLLEDELRVSPGEYLSMGILVSTDIEMSNFSVDIQSKLNKNGALIEPRNIDVRIAKEWYQASVKKINPERNGRFLTYELLLHDESLIKVEKATKKNHLKVNGSYKEISCKSCKILKNEIFKDSETIRPITLATKRKVLYWFTIRPRKEMTSGLYEFEVSFYSDNQVIKKLPILIKILPFSLPKPSLDYGLYYRARLTGGKNLVPGSDFKTPSQYKAELINMKNHGIAYPTLYEKMSSGYLIDALTLRSDIGFPSDKIFVLGLITNKLQDLVRLNKFGMQVKKWKGMVNTFGYKELYIYTIDEAKVDDLPGQFASWQVVHNAGARLFGAFRNHSFGIAGDKIDIPVIPGRYVDSSEVLSWKVMAESVYVYSNPQVGVEDAELYRRNYGFLLWLSPYAGVLNYAYQHGFNDIWNDFDHNIYRDHVFAYPTTKGLIDTVQWEGFREGVDDTRYIDYLSRKLGKDVAGSLLKGWMSTSETMHQVRQKVIDKILSISN